MKEKEALQDNRLATLDIFAGCGGLSEGLQQSGTGPFLFLCQPYELISHSNKLVI